MLMSKSMEMSNRKQKKNIGEYMENINFVFKLMKFKGFYWVQNLKSGLTIKQQCQFLQAHL